jgi:L-threonylcarbamoyladenylate synthase
MMLLEEIEEASKVILRGDVILCPTDTIWGLSADARNEAAVDKVFEIKQRPNTKSMIVLVESLAMLENYVDHIPALALELIQNASRPTSIIYPKSKNLAQNVPAQNGSVAIRIVRQGFCHHLIQKLGFPIISTSANVSGSPSPENFSSIEEAIKMNVQLCVDESLDESKEKASSIFLIEGNNIQQIR